MPKFVVYEVWTRARVVEAATGADAYDIYRPEVPDADNLSLCNWHVVQMGNNTPTPRKLDRAHGK